MCFCNTATVQRCCLQAFDDLSYILKTDQRYTDYDTRDKCMIQHQSPLSTTLIKHPQINSNGFWRFGWRPGSPCVSGAVIFNYLLFTSFLLYVISYIPRCPVLLVTVTISSQWYPGNSTASDTFYEGRIMWIIMQSWPFFLYAPVS